MILLAQQVFCGWKEHFHKFWDLPNDVNCTQRRLSTNIYTWLHVVGKKLSIKQKKAFHYRGLMKWLRNMVYFSWELTFFESSGGSYEHQPSKCHKKMGINMVLTFFLK